MTRRRIYVIQTDAAGCALYRLINPLTHLNLDEFEVVWSPPPPDAPPGSIVIGQRIAGRNEAWLEMCANPDLVAVYDIDDNLMLVDPTNVPIFNIYNPIAADTAANVAAADVVTVSTQKLGDQLRHLNSNIVVLPNCLNGNWFAPLPPERPFVVGWAGSMFHGNDFAGIPEQLREFHLANPWVQFHTIGADYFGASIPRRVSGFQAMPNYHATLNFSVGIAPLQDTPFNQGKSGVKILEYGARAIPTIASSVGQYPELIEHGVNGFLMKEPSELSHYLTLMLDDETRSSMSEAAYATAQQYSIANQIHRWEALCREA